jgi:hypothetical protein
MNNRRLGLGQESNEQLCYGSVCIAQLRSAEVW